MKCTRKQTIKIQNCIDGIARREQKSMQQKFHWNSENISEKKQQQQQKNAKQIAN